MNLLFRFLVWSLYYFLYIVRGPDYAFEKVMEMLQDIKLEEDYPEWAEKRNEIRKRQ